MTEQEYEEAVEIVAKELAEREGLRWIDLEPYQREWHTKDASSFLTHLTWPSGQPVIGVLAKDQTFPDPLYPESGALYRNGHEDARFVALDAGFRRVIQEAKK